MDLKAKPVASAMDKVTPQPFTLQEASGGCIHRAGGYPSPHNVPCGSLGFQYGLVPLADTGGRPANVHGARKIATIAAQYSTQVQHDQLISPDLADRGTRMGQRRTGSCGHDGLEGLPGCTLAAHPKTDLGRKIKFGHPGSHQAYCLLHDLGADSGRIPNSFDFRAIFDRAESVHKTVDGQPANALPRRLFEGSPTRKAEPRGGNDSTDLTLPAQIFAYSGP